MEVNGNLQNQKLCMDLWRWPLQICKLAHTFTRIPKNCTFQAYTDTYTPYCGQFVSICGGCGQMVKSLHQIACEFELDQSQLKSVQVVTHK